MADVTGARGTANVTQAQRKVDMRQDILLLEPDAAPLTVLTSRIGAKPTVNPEYSWMQDALDQRFDAVQGAQTNVQTAIPVAVGANFAAHDLVKVTRTGELFRVVSVATNTLTVVRGVGSGGTGIAINNLDEVLIVGSAQPEGDTSKPARSTNPTKTTNYTQIQRNPFESTETLLHSDTFTEPADWEYNANKKGIEHKKSLELQYWQGKPSEDLTGSQPRRTSGGVLYYITTNITDAGGTLTETVFFQAARPAFRYGPNRKVLFSSARIVDVLNTFPRGKLQTIQADDSSTYGLNVRQFVSPHGTINVVTHWLLEGTTYGGYAALLDLSQVRKRVLANRRGSRDTHVLDGIQAPDADTMKSEYLTESGLEFGNEKKHALIVNVTNG